MRDGACSSAGSKREYIQLLWKAFFADPTEWWDYRLFKKNPKAPDFQHKSTQDKLWLDGTRNPSWVYPLLAKRDKKCPCPPYAVPAPMLERYKKEEALAAIGKPTVKQTNNVQGCNAGSTETRARQTKKSSKGHADAKVSTLEKRKREEATSKHGVSCKSTPSIVKSKSKQMQKTKNSDAGNSGTCTKRPRKKSKGYTIGEVCDWHTLSVEDSIDALEKGTFNEPSVETLAHIVCKCTKKKDKGSALLLLGYLRRNGLESDEVLGNHVVLLLVEIDVMDQAQLVFDKLVARNEETWNTLIMGYAKRGESRRVIDLYKLMRQDRKLHLSKYNFVFVFKACGSLKDAQTGRLAHSDAARNGLLKTNAIVGNALLDMYSKCGSLSEARGVFDILPERSVITWTTLMAGYAQHGNGLAALNCFKSMQYAGVTPNAFTFSAALKACGMLKKSALGMELHAKVEEDGLLASSQTVGNALIDMYAKCGLLKKAQETFDVLPAHDVVSWNALITGYTEHGFSEEATSCLEKMQAAGIKPNAVTFASCLKACANARAIKKGEEIHSEIRARGLINKDVVLGSSLLDMYAKCGHLDKAKAVFAKLPAKDVFAWTALIAGYTQHDDCEKALACFRQMQVKGTAPDAIAYSSVLKACSSFGAITMGNELCDDILREGLLHKNASLCNVVVDMYAKFGMLKEAQEVFMMIPFHDVATWTALITGYAHLGEADKAFYLFCKMREDSVIPTSVTILGVLHAFTTEGLVDAVLGLVEAMSEYCCILPTLEHCICVIDLLGRVGKVNMAMALVFNIPFHPNVVTWLSLLSACQKWDHMRLASIAFEQVMLLDEGEASAYVCLSNIHADAGVREKSEVVQDDIRNEEGLVIATS